MRPASRRLCWVGVCFPGCDLFLQQQCCTLLSDNACFSVGCSRGPSSHNNPRRGLAGEAASTRGQQRTLRHAPLSAGHGAEGEPTRGRGSLHACNVRPLAFSPSMPAAPLKPHQGWADVLSGRRRSHPRDFGSKLGCSCWASTLRRIGLRPRASWRVTYGPPAGGMRVGRTLPGTRSSLQSAVADVSFFPSWPCGCCSALLLRRSLTTPLLHHHHHHFVK